MTVVAIVDVDGLGPVPMLVLAAAIALWVWFRNQQPQQVHSQGGVGVHRQGRAMVVVLVERVRCHRRG
jgi:hypothetical protein